MVVIPKREVVTVFSCATLRYAPVIICAIPRLGGVLFVTIPVMDIRDAPVIRPAMDTRPVSAITSAINIRDASRAVITVVTRKPLDAHASAAVINTPVHVIASAIARRSLALVIMVFMNK